MHGVTYPSACDSLIDRASVDSASANQILGKCIVAEMLSKTLATPGKQTNEATPKPIMTRIEQFLCILDYRFTHSGDKVFLNFVDRLQKLFGGKHVIFTKTI